MAPLSYSRRFSLPWLNNPSQNLSVEKTGGNSGGLGKSLDLSNLALRLMLGQDLSDLERCRSKMSEFRRGGSKVRDSIN